MAENSGADSSSGGHIPQYIPSKHVPLTDQLEKDKVRSSKRGGSAVEFSAVRLLVEERDPIVLPLPKDGEAVATPASFELKERCKYRLQFEFTVANDVVLGLTYVNTVYKDGDQVDTSKEMLGAYAPQAKPYVYVTEEETTPDGEEVRGKYTAETKHSMTSTSSTSSLRAMTRTFLTDGVTAQGIALPHRCAPPASRTLSLLSSTSRIAPHFPRSTRRVLTRADPKGDARELWRREIEADSAAATDFEAVDADTVREEAQRLTRKQVMERLDKASYQELRELQESGYDSDGGSTRPGLGGKSAESGEISWKEVVDKILVADFFLITIALVWFLTGVLQRSISNDDGLLLAWLKLWDPLFQPAIGVFMGSAVLQAVLKKSA
ncbi:unnamed protein product [Closterium sp. NIES-65]|nr:unnamed protein product [Closterium sp. NIES-65]